MKNLSYTLFALLFVVITLGACEKQTFQEPLKPADTTPLEAKLVTTSLSVKKNEPDTLTLVGAENENVTWHITPFTHSVIKKEGNKLIVSFQEFGGYTITASAKGQTFLSNPGCWDNVNYTKRSYDNIDVVMTPRYFRSKTSNSVDSIFFAFEAEIHTTKVCNNENYNPLTDRTTNDIKMQFWYIGQPEGNHCTPATSTDYPIVKFFYPLSVDPAKRYKLNIDYPISIKKGATIYTGSVRFSETTMDITWNYTTGLTFSTKQAAVELF